MLKEKEIQEFYEAAKEGLHREIEKLVLMMKTNASIIDYQHQLCNLEFFRVRCQLLEYILEVPRTDKIVKYT